LDVAAQLDFLRQQLRAGAAILGALVGKAHAVFAREFGGGFQDGTGHWGDLDVVALLQDVPHLTGPTVTGKKFGPQPPDSARFGAGLRGFFFMGSIAEPSSP